MTIAIRGCSVALSLCLLASACSGPTPPNPTTTPPGATATPLGATATPPGATTPLPTGQASASESPLASPPPTSQELIAAALAAGQIDEPTALEYRVFALFGDSRLPTEFNGAPDPVVDSEALDDARTRLSDLPAGIATALKPYTVRPNDPESLFSKLQTAPVGSPTAGGPIELAAARSKADFALEVAPCFQGWTTVPSLKHHFEVWARCADGWNDADPQLLEDLGTVVAMVDSTWTQESAFMGVEPLPDKPGQPIINDSDWVDVYLLSRQEGVIDGQDLSLNPDYAAAAMYTPTSDPNAAVGTSGYLLLNRDRMSLPGDQFRGDVIHEFFHIVELARNENATRNVRWFGEATAEWAQTFFQPERAAQDVHDEWFPKFIQHPQVSLTDDSDRNHRYEDYIWAFFMQEQFGPTSISQAWKKLGTLPGSESDVLNAISDAIGGFPAVFRDFAVRNFNQDLDPSDANAPAKRLHQAWVDIGTFPASTPPYVNAGVPEFSDLKGSSKAIPFSDPIDSLSAHYYKFTVDDSVGQVVFDFSEFGPHDALDVDALVAIKDQSKPAGVRWERRRIEAVPDQLKFCRNDPKNDVMKIYLVLTNHAKDPTVKVGDTFKVFSPAQPCLLGDLTIHVEHTSTGDTPSHDEYTLDLHVDLRFENGQWVTGGGSWSLSGSQKIDGPHTPLTCWPFGATWTGQGTWLPPGEAGSGAEGDGTFTFFVGSDHVPGFNGLVIAHVASSDKCASNESSEPYTFSWPQGSACTLDAIANVPCTVTGTGPAAVGPDDTGPYDLTGSVTITEKPPSGTVEVTNYSVTGALGAPPQ